jgi:hypothetical protein
LPFRKNIEREDTLRKHWIRGKTVEAAALLTGIPKGSVSHYYARFNRRRERERVRRRFSGQEPPRSTPTQVAAAAMAFTKMNEVVLSLAQKGDFAKARDSLEMLKRWFELEERFSHIIGNIDKSKDKDVFHQIILLTQALRVATNSKS